MPNLFKIFRKKRIKVLKKKVPAKKIRRIVKIRRKLKPEKRKILVSDLMTRNIISVTPYQSLDEVVRIFQTNKISGAPVLDKDFFIGEISKTDILNFIKKGSLEEIDEKDRKVLSEKIVAEFMKKPICIREDATLESAKKKMEKYNIKRLLVLDKKKRLVGIITKSDLLKWAPKQEIKDRIATKIDEMIKVLEEGPMEARKLSKILNTPENLIESWAKTLEEYGLVEISYPAIGSPVIKLKKS
ncbi:MAG: CBS domain-containing protein [Candidatus Aenigmatarchaeota archaeon]